MIRDDWVEGLHVDDVLEEYCQREVLLVECLCSDAFEKTCAWLAFCPVATEAR